MIAHRRGLNIPPFFLPVATNTMSTMPLKSSLPMDDEDFREIVFQFADRLNQRLGEMEEALDIGAYDSLARLAHWLKGTGGMAGFADFTLPAASL
jgi:HPt (histidine-containing phosphotransfer) domain-containing protein